MIDINEAIDDLIDDINSSYSICEDVDDSEFDIEERLMYLESINNYYEYTSKFNTDANAPAFSDSNSRFDKYLAKGEKIANKQNRKYNGLFGLGGKVNKRDQRMKDAADRFNQSRDDLNYIATAKYDKKEGEVANASNKYSRRKIKNKREEELLQARNNYDSAKRLASPTAQPEKPSTYTGPLAGAVNGVINTVRKGKRIKDDVANVNNQKQTAKDNYDATVAAINDKYDAELNKLGKFSYGKDKKEFNKNKIEQMKIAKKNLNNVQRKGQKLERDYLKHTINKAVKAENQENENQANKNFKKLAKSKGIKDINNLSTKDRYKLKYDQNAINEYRKKKQAITNKIGNANIITCSNCQNRYHKTAPKCPKCGTANPNYVKPVQKPVQQQNNQQQITN